MACKSFFAVFLVYWTLIVQVAGQEGEEGCRPDVVQAVIITWDTNLLWAPPYNENCVWDHYFVYIRNGTQEFTFKVVRNFIPIDFLEVCEFYTFGVIVVSPEGIQSDPVETYGKVPYPIDTDLHISLFRASPRDNGIHLEWEVEVEWRKCPESFRLTVYDVDTDYPVDFYVSSNNATITDIVPCGQYIMGIRALFNLGLEGSYTSTRVQALAANITAPILRDVTLGSTTIELRWQLENWSSNRCSISSLTVDGSPYFKITYPVIDQINRPPIPVRLTGLEPDTMYHLTVTAVNVAGESPPALVNVQTLESS